MTRNFKRNFFEFISGYQWWIVGLLIILDIFLGFAGFFEKISSGSATEKIALDALYQTFLMFAFESVAQENVPVTLEIARWMTIFIAGFAVIKAVMVIGRHEINSLRLKFFNRHIIVCGLNNKGAVLIDSCLNRPAAGKIIVIEPDRENDLAAIYHDKGVIVINGNPTDPSVLKKARVSRASYLFALTNNDECNVEIALKAYQIIRPSAVNTSGPEGQDILNCYVHVFDSNLQALFKQHALFRDPFDRFNGRVINIYETSARLVFNLYPPDRLNGARFRQLDSPPAHIVVVGFGNLGKNVTLQAIRLGHYANLKRTAISVLDLDIKAREKKFKAVYPGIESLVEINFREIDPESLNLEEIKKLNDRYPVSVVYVCIEDDSAGFLTRLQAGPGTGGLSRRFPFRRKSNRLYAGKHRAVIGSGTQQQPQKTGL